MAYELIKTLGSGSAIQNAIDAGFIYCGNDVDDKIRIFQNDRGADFPFVDLFGSSGTGNKQFDSIHSIAVNASNLYIADKGNHRVQIINKTSPYAYVNQFGTFGTGDGEFNGPKAIGIDDTHIYVLDATRVQKFDISTFAFVATATITGNALSVAPTGATDQYMYLTNTSTYKVKMYSKSALAFVTEFGGTNGEGDGEFMALMAGVAVDDTYIYVNDHDNSEVFSIDGRMQVFDIGSPFAFVDNYIAPLSSGGLDGLNVLDGFIISGHSNSTKILKLAAPPDTPTGLAATCVKESIPEVKGITMTVISEGIPMTVQFNSGLGSGYTYAWESGNGDTSTDEEPIFEYPSAGNYEIRLTATNSFGSWTFTQPAIIDTEHSIDMPIALFTADVQAGVSPLAVVFTDNSTGDISDWEWYVDDVLESSVQAFSHNFTSDGTYIVRLKVIGSGEAEAEMTVRAGPLANLPPIVTLMGASETKSIIGSLTTIFSATVDGVVDTYLWEFGDGFSSSDASPEHPYSKPGTYTAKLTVTNTEGPTSASFTIRVMHLPAMEKAEVGAYIGSDKIGFYAVDALNNKVLVYKSETEFITSFGSPGAGEGQFNNPTGMTVVGGVRLIDSIEI